VAAIGALGGLAAAIIEGGVRGWGNPWVLVGSATAATFAALFLFREQRARQPMLPLSLFSLTSLVGVLVNVAFYGLIFVPSLYFQQIGGLSALATGLAFLPMMAAVLMANLMAARATRRLGALAVIAAGALIVAGGCITLIGIDRGRAIGRCVPSC